MKKKPSELDNTQLYRLFLKYNTYVDNMDDRGIIMGYTIIDALIHNIYNGNSEEERKFQEVKSVYKNLNLVLEELVQKETTYVISDMQLKVEKGLNENTHYQSEILNEFIPILIKKKNPINYVRNIGIKLCETIEEKGQFEGRRNILLNDHDTLKNTYR